MYALLYVLLYVCTSVFPCLYLSSLLYSLLVYTCLYFLSGSVADDSILLALGNGRTKLGLADANSFSGLMFGMEETLIFPIPGKSFGRAPPLASMTDANIG